MCGICGMVNDNDKTILKKMTDVVEHRGPNDHGFYVDDDVAIGNRRLSIIDLSGGRQPISNEDGSIWITFNGEIYNFKELRASLEKSHRFTTNTDTEVIVHLYEDLGPDCVKELRGMFAFAIWDSGRKLLLLARDRLGKKPLYYSRLGDKLLFASEIKSLLQHPDMKRGVDKHALGYYISLHYVPGPLTLFKGINKLLPGHIAVYQDNKLAVKKYWDLNFSAGNESDGFYIKKFWELLSESVKMRLMSEVPLGVYLSGGLDSNAILSVMSEEKKSAGVTDSIKTFTVGFDDPNFGELEFGKLSAEFFGTDHHSITVTKEDIKFLPEIIWHYDEPVANTASIPLYVMSREAKKHVTVVLTGEGGDELLAGYRQYKKMKFETLPVPNPIKMVSERLSLGVGGKLSRRLKYLSAVGDLDKVFLFFVGDFDGADKKMVLSQEFLNQLNADSVNQFIRSYLDKQEGGSLNKILYLDTKVSLPDDMLMKADKMTMAHSIEARTPLLDHIFAEFCAAIPNRLKIGGGVSKIILRKVLAGKVPDAIVNKRKTGFSIPKVTWLNDIKELVPQILSKESIIKRNYFNEKILGVINNYDKNSQRIWSLLMLEIWHRIFIDSDNPKPIASIDKLL